MCKHPAKIRTTRTNTLRNLAIACLVLVCLSVTTCLHAKDYSFAWTANPEPVEGYKLYYKKGGEPAPPFDGSDSLDGPSPIDIGKQTTFTITGLDETATYHFALTAYNGTDESGYTAVITVNGSPIVGAPPPRTGSKAFTFNVEDSNSADIVAYRIYVNDTLLCESANAAETTITCYADLLNETMSFTVAAVDSSGTEISRSNALVFNPADIPQLYNKRSATFTWEFDATASSVSGFKIYQNDKLICETADPGVRILTCEITLEATNVFKLAAIDTSGGEITVSNLLTYATEITAPETNTLAAVMTTSSQEGEAPFTVTFDATTSTGAIDTYSWSFGDGDSATGSKTIHTYTYPGTYTANLTVADASNITAQANSAIMVNAPGASPAETQTPPTAVISSSTAVGDAPLAVQFDGASSSATQPPINSYTWKFGDGSISQGGTSTHTYSVPGTYQASLTVTDNVGLTGQTSTPVIINAPPSTTNQSPVSIFTVSPYSGAVPVTVSFDGSGANDPDGTISEYLWSFGDGTSATGSTCQHTFQATGDYTVTLKVIDNNGSAAVSSLTIQALAQGETPFNFELLEANLDQNWVRLTFEHEYKNPVVVAGPPSFNDAEPTTVRLKNIDATGFDARLQEWEHQDGVHTPETISFLVMERGVHTTDNGGKIEAGAFTGATSFKRINLQQTYGKTPIILPQIITENEPDAVVGRLRNITTDSFEYTMQERELTPTAHGPETIGYIAWEPGEGEVLGLPYKADSTAQTIADTWSDLILQTEYPASPLLVAQLQTNVENGPASLRSRVTPTSIQIKVEEETSADQETIHMAEVVGYLVIGDKAAGETGSTSSLIKNFIFSWESATSTNIAGYRFYLNGNILCETTDPTARQHTCKAALLYETMHFSMTSVLTDGTETEPSAILSISPDDYPDLFGIRLATFEWQYDDSAESGITGFGVYNNDSLVCETMNPSDRKLTCKVQIDSRSNAFSIRARALDGSQTGFSNTLQYTPLVMPLL